MKSLKHYLQNIKSNYYSIRANSFGKNVSQKLIIIESDDWGAIRTSRKAITAFKKRGFDIADSIYMNDALESNDDLQFLFDLLLSFKDQEGSPVKFTANAVIANPNFNKIKESDFTQYFFEPVNETFDSYPNHSKSLEFWKEAIDKNIFKPQFHGREHLNYKRWLNELKNGNEDALFCFDLKTTFSGKSDYSFMEAFDWDTEKDIIEQKNVLREGLDLFEKILGYRSKTFIAPCYNWDIKVEEVLAEKGIKLIQGLRNQYAPTGKFERYNKIPHKFGELNSFGTAYNIRNCIFEPAMNSKKDWVDSCIRQISNAFSFNKPAVICSHRINYIGYINPSNREYGLKELRKLLNNILAKWPQVKFISSDELLKYWN